MSAAKWLRDHARDIPAELPDSEGLLSLDYRFSGDEGESGALIDRIPDEDYWFMARDYEEDVGDPDQDWLF
jgi:hypothetical protein